MMKHNMTTPMSFAAILCLTAAIASAQPTPAPGAPDAPPPPQPEGTQPPPPPRDARDGGGPQGERPRPGAEGPRQRGQHPGMPGGAGGPMGGPGMMPPGGMRGMPGMPGMGEVQMQDATYLGIEVSPIDPAMKAQLKLTKTDSGLLVNFVADNSPAKTAGLQQYDVLAKLDDQILFNPAQLQSLVRIHKAGDEVKLTYIREGQVQTTTAKLETKQQMVQPLGGPWGGGMPPFMMQGPGGDGDRFRQGMGNMGNGPSRTVTYDAEDMSLNISADNGKVTLVAKDKSGKELYNGQIDTPEQRAALPEAVRKALTKVADNYLVTSLARPARPMGFGRGMGGPGRDGGSDR